MTRALVFVSVVVCSLAAQQYSTNFSGYDPVEWTLENGCSHCSSHGSHTDECTQYDSKAVAYGVVSNGTGMNLTSAPLLSPSSCGGKCSSGHLEWRGKNVTFGTFAVVAKWFPGHSNVVQSADGFIGLWGPGEEGGSITFIFHGKGWDSGGDDFTHTFQSECYRTGQGHNKINTNVTPDLHSTFNLFELVWLPDQVHWRVNGKTVRSYQPGNSSTIPQKNVVLRLHTRSGHCPKMVPGSSFDAQVLNFSYTPAEI